MHVGFHVNIRFCCHTLMKLEYAGQILDKSINIKFHENPSSVPCDQSEGRTDNTKLIVVFHNSAKAPKTE